jgi:AraC-like DNA-binding protein
VTDLVSVFRPSPTPRLALPFGIRSLGRRTVGDARTIDHIPPRNFAQVYWCVTGGVAFQRDDGTVTVGPGQVFVYPSRSWHRISCPAGGVDYWWITVDGPLADAVIASFDLKPPWPRHAGPLPERLFARLQALLADPSPMAERAAAAVGWEILSAAASAGQSGGDDSAVERLRAELVDRSADPELSVARLAETLGEDRSVLTRRFTRVHGVAPKQYLQSLRLSRAMSLLHGSQAPVAEVARACGFSDPGYFARAFRKAAGLSPEEFRRG